MIRHVYPTHVAVGSLERRANQNPDSVTIETPSGAITAATLWADVSETCERLVRAGVEPGDLILLTGDRSAGFVIALLGVWKTGAIPAMVDAAYPKQMVERMGLLVGAGWRLDARATVLSKLNPVHDRVRVPEEASHVLFTSGTSGVPKPVLAGAGSLEVLLDRYQETFDVGADDRFVLVGSVGHDPVLRDILVPLAIGAVLVVPPEDALSTPGVLAEVIRDRKVTVLHATPALLEFGLLSDVQPVFGLRRILCGGARLSASTARAVLEAAPQGRLFNVYGATETPQIASFMEITSDTVNVDPATPMPVGSGFGDTELRVVSGDSRVGGEVVVVGRHLACGYLATDIVESGFGPDPDGRDGWRAYRTGDRARVEESGLVTVVGRIDRQVSLNGYRFELDEIEAVAASMDGAHGAVAEVRETAFGQSVMLTVAFTPDDQGALPGRGTIRSYLKEWLPSWAVPSGIKAVKGQLGRNSKSIVSSVVDPTIEVVDG